MRVEGDFHKNQANVQKHGLNFAGSEEVLGDVHLTFEDQRRDYGENRFITVGLLRGRMVVLVYTKRGDIYRIISMRKANEREQKTYQNELKKTG